MISGSLTLLAVEDAEFSRIRLSTDTIVVDPYNVQTEPLVIKVELVSGADVSSASAYLSVQAVSIGNPVPGAVRDFGLCSKAEFTIPAKDKLYATATAIRVDAYADAGKKNLIEGRTVNVVCSQIPTPVSRGEKWMKETIFRNGDFLEHKVGNASSIYMWSSRVEGNTSKAPWDITLTTDPEYGYWEHVTERTILASKILMARGALVGSAVFNGDFMISQQGEAKVEGATYKDFEETMSKFVPNIMMNFLTGAARFNHVEVVGDSRFGGHLDGAEGTFNRLECTDGQGRKIVLAPSPDGADRPSVSFYDADGKKVYNVSFDDKLTRSATIELFRYDSLGNETNSCLLHSNGIVRGTMPGKSFTLTPNGLTYNRVIDGVEKAWLTYPSDRKVVALTGGNYNVGTDDFFIRSVNGTNNVYLPDASTCPGRVIYFKKTSGGNYTYLNVGNNVPGGIIDENNSTSVKQYEINQNVALFVVSDATDWIVFYCG